MGRHSFGRSLAMLAFTLLYIVPSVVPASQAGTAPPAVWVDVFNGPSNHQDWGTLLAVDPTGPIYVAGTTYVPGNGWDEYLLIRYQVDGTLDWFRTYGNGSTDEPSDLLVPEPGHIVITGFSRDDTSVDVATVLYDSAGDIVWEQRYRLSAPPLLDFPPALAQDADGNLIVTGQTEDDYLILKYSSDGALIWDRTYDGPQEGADFPRDVAVDDAGSVYVTGVVGSAAGIGTIKLDSSGAFQWEHVESGDIGSVFQYAGVEVAPDGNVVVVGNPESFCGLFQVRVWKCDASTGDPIWVESFPDDPCDNVEPTDMGIDGEGNVLITGFGRISTSSIHFQTIKYGPDGKLLWHNDYDGPGTSSDVAEALDIDDEGNVYVAGLTTFPPQNRDYAAVKYAPDGTEEWDVHWAGPFESNEGALDIVVSEAQDVFLTGHGWNPDENENIMTIRYQQQDPVNVPTEFDRAGAFDLRPSCNPCSGGTAIRYELAQAGAVRLTILDAAGRLVQHLRSATEDAGSHEVLWSGEDTNGRRVASGIYFVRLEVDRSSSETVRLSLIH